MKSRLLCLCFSLIACLGVAPQPAAAGTYDVHVCKGTDGRYYGTTGWTALQPQSGVYYDLGCDDGGFGLSTGPLPGPLPATFRTGWQFALPQPITIASLDAEYQSSVTEWKGWEAQVWARRHNEPQWLDVTTCSGENCVASFKNQPMYGMGAMAFGIRCESSGCATGSYASMRVAYFKLHLNDPVTPRIASAVGQLAEGGTISGPTSVSFTASDSESGVRAAALEVDGHVVASTAFDSDSHSCHEPFTVVRPCPSTARGMLGVDTSAMNDGVHVARLLVYDATTTNVGIAGPWSFTSSNRHVSNLCGAALGPSARTVLRPRVVAYGHGAVVGVRWPTVPWSQAEALLLTGRRTLSLSSPVRLKQSRALLDVSRGRNRIVRVGVRPAGASSGFACSKPLKLKVRAAATLRAHPRLLSNGQRVKLRGMLRGGSIARGRTVVLEARARNGRPQWTPVKVLHTDRRSKFAFSYRFARTYQRTHYLFRARIPAQRGFPFAAGHSRRVPVLVAP